jgi:hypothetical protein
MLGSLAFLFIAHRPSARWISRTGEIGTNHQKKGTDPLPHPSLLVEERRKEASSLEKNPYLHLTDWLIHLPLELTKVVE